MQCETLPYVCTAVLRMRTVYVPGNVLSFSFLFLFASAIERANVCAYVRRGNSMTSVQNERTIVRNPKLKEMLQPNEAGWQCSGNRGYLQEFNVS